MLTRTWKTVLTKQSTLLSRMLMPWEATLTPNAHDVQLLGCESNDVGSRDVWEDANETYITYLKFVFYIKVDEAVNFTHSCRWYVSAMTFTLSAAWDVYLMQQHDHQTCNIWIKCNPLCSLVCFFLKTHAGPRSRSEWDAWVFEKGPLNWFITKGLPSSQHNPKGPRHYQRRILLENRWKWMPGLWCYSGQVNFLV